MKTKLTVFGLLLLFAFGLVSCGDDDDKRISVPVEEEILYTLTISISGSKGTTLPPAYTVTIDSILTKEKATNLLGANEQKFQRGKSYFGVFGLSAVSDTTILRNFKIKVGENNEINLGNCYQKGVPGVGFLAEVEQSDDMYTDIIKTIFDEVIVKKSSSVKISYDLNEDIAREKNVTFKLRMVGIYKYNTYPAEKK